MADVERLRQVVGRAGVAQFARPARRGVGAEDDDGDAAGAGGGLQLAGNLLAGDVGQVQIEEDEVGANLGGQFDAPAAEGAAIRRPPGRWASSMRR